MSWGQLLPPTHAAAYPDGQSEMWPPIETGIELNTGSPFEDPFSSEDMRTKKRRENKVLDFFF